MKVTLESGGERAEVWQEPGDKKTLYLRLSPGLKADPIRRALQTSHWICGDGRQLDLFETQEVWVFKHRWGGWGTRKTALRIIQHKVLDQFLCLSTERVAA